MMFKISELVHIGVDGHADVSFHPGQKRAWLSKARFVFIYAGTQGGKTSFLPWWLDREIVRTAVPSGDNDYLAATASYDLFKLKFLPEMRNVFEQYLRKGRYWSGSRIIELKDPNGKFWAKQADERMWGRIILRSAQAEGGLESATAKAAVLDECGQDEFRVDHWEAVQRRLSLNQGRVLGATTLYNRGWTKSEVYDKWLAGDPSFEVIQFPSYQNPSFPVEEFERMRRILPAWKFNMFYKGEFDIPEGLIYQPFDTMMDVCDDFPIPDDWTLWGGIDFGGINTAAVLFAERPPDKHLFLIREYLMGERTAAGHARELVTWQAKRWWGGSGSEDQWRREFGNAGLPILQPMVSDVEVGIDSVYGVLASHDLTVFRSCRRWLDEVGTYARMMDQSGKPSEKIADKEQFHLMDATRYVLPALRRKRAGAKAIRLDG